ncbi:hypothetical protein [Nonomuraea endophytica]|uniref:hypothetical protein n=1 Tax=Nonomuraea endophytica TaxID=714136 RepID=UPI0037C54821
MPADQVHAAALLSDGVSRPVDRFAIITWHSTLDVVAERSPAALLKQVRDAERSDPEGKRRPQSMMFDDTIGLRTGMPLDVRDPTHVETMGMLRRERHREPRGAKPSTLIAR